MLNTLTQQIRKNCNISDARHAGLYSICGLALRLRDLFKWEHGLPPWIEKDSGEVLEWIGEKEELWDRLQQSEYRRLTFNGRTFDPFDAPGVNQLLFSHDLFYGAGYAHSLKPTFLLADIRHRRSVNGHKVFFLGREMARDMLTLPAFAQDQSIVIREDAARMYLWDQMFYINKSGRPALQFALIHCGVPDQRPETLQQHLDTIYDQAKDIFVYHEIGEAQDTVFDNNVWREIIGHYAHTPIELLARTVKDLLADTGEAGSLRFFIRNRRTAALGFYVAFMGHFTKMLFPELRSGFVDFVMQKDWRVIEQTVEKGYRTARRYAEEMTAFYQKGLKKNDLQWTADAIDEKLLAPVIGRHKAA